MIAVAGIVVDRLPIGVRIGEDAEVAIAKLRSKSSPLDEANLILEQSNLPITMVISGGEIRATRGGSPYSHARMSDGERIALILTAEVKSAAAESVFIIDEPELHLHRAIVVPLISALIASRSDCTFIISTHELDLPKAVSDSSICIVRSVDWSIGGEVSQWDVDVLDNAALLPDDLITDILGSRRKVLFTEGLNCSLDVPLYATLFPNISVVPKGSCGDVQKAVIGMSSTKYLHHSEAFGLIDNDGMSDAVISDFQEQGIYALPVFAVESLYYDCDVVRAVAERQAATMKSKPEDQESLVAEYLTDLTDRAIAAASKPGVAEHLSARLSERHLRDALIDQLPKREQLVTNTVNEITISFVSTYTSELSRFKQMIEVQDVFGIVARYAVRHSGVLAEIAKALKFQSRSDYEAASLARISTDNVLADKLRAKLGALSSALA